MCLRQSQTAETPSQTTSRKKTGIGKKSKNPEKSRPTIYDMALYQLARCLNQGDLDAMKFVLTHPNFRQIYYADVVKMAESTKGETRQ